MTGKMVLKPKKNHSSKPEEITLKDGSKVKSIQYTEADDTLV